MVLGSVRVQVCAAPSTCFACGLRTSFFFAMSVPKAWPRRLHRHGGRLLMLCAAITSVHDANVGVGAVSASRKGTGKSIVHALKANLQWTQYGGKAVNTLLSERLPLLNGTGPASQADMIEHDRGITTLRALIMAAREALRDAETARNNAHVTVDGSVSLAANKRAIEQAQVRVEMGTGSWACTSDVVEAQTTLAHGRTYQVSTRNVSRHNKEPRNPATSARTRTATHALIFTVCALRCISTAWLCINCTHRITVVLLLCCSNAYTGHC